MGQTGYFLVYTTSRDETSMFTQSSQWLTIMGYKKFPGGKPHRFLKSIVMDGAQRSKVLMPL